MEVRWTVESCSLQVGFPQNEYLRRINQMLFICRREVRLKKLAVTSCFLPLANIYQCDTLSNLVRFECRNRSGGEVPNGNLRTSAFSDFF